MLYLLLGALLRRAADAVASGSVAGDDPYSQRQQRRLALLVGRIGRLTPRLPAALDRQNQHLITAIQEAGAVLAAHGLDPPVPPSDVADPLERHVALMRGADEAVTALHGRIGEEWASIALADLRAHLAATVKVEADMVQEVLRWRPSF